MAGCTDSHYEKMLYAYELGLLSDMDRAAVEMHHLECESCFEKSRNFNTPIRLIRCDTDFRETIFQITPEDAIESAKTVKSDDRRRWPIWFRSAIAAAAVLILLLLQPLKIELSSRQELTASENLLIILPFTNLVEADDPQRLGKIVSNLIITGLTERQEIQIVSEQHLFDLSKTMGIENEVDFNSILALQMGKKAHARWIVTGSILQTEPEFVVTTQLVDVASGNIVHAQKMQGSTETSIFSLADSLAILIKSDLPLVSQPREGTDQMVASITTHSQDAYRLYLEGVDYYNRAYLEEAVEKFEEALVFDSSFAMVYYYLSNLKDTRLINKASEFAQQATQMERLYIFARQAFLTGDNEAAFTYLLDLVKQFPYEKRAYYLIGVNKYRLRQNDEAITFLNKSIALDPLFAEAYNILAYTYCNLENMEVALTFNAKFIFLAPNEPNPYDSRGDIFAMFRMYSKAAESYKMALEKKDDFHASWSKLGKMYTFTGDFVNAEKCFQVIASEEDIYIWTNGKVLLGHNLMYQGKLAEALAMLRIGSAEDEKAHGEKWYATYHFIPALMYEELGEFDKALDELEAGNAIQNSRGSGNRTYWKRYQARIVANSGDLTRAQRMTDSLKAMLESNNESAGAYWYALGTIELARKNYSEAEIHFRKAIEELESFDYSSQYLLGVTLHDAGKFAESIEVLESVLEAQDSMPMTWTSWDARLYYYLGLSFEGSGNQEKAIENYTRYLDLRENADIELPTVTDTEKRLRNLIL